MEFDRRIRVVPTLPDSYVLVEELQAFLTRVPVAVSTDESKLECPNEDPVLAVAVAAWLGERRPPRAADL